MRDPWIRRAGRMQVLGCRDACDWILARGGIFRLAIFWIKEN